MSFVALQFIMAEIFIKEYYQLYEGDLERYVVANLML